MARAHKVNNGAAFNTFDTPAMSMSATSISLNLIGMRAQSDFTITITATDDAGRTSTAVTSFRTPALPPTIPAIDVVMNDITRTAPGYLVLNMWEFSGEPIARIGAIGSAVVALDQEMQVVWYFNQKIVTDPQKIPGGNGNWVGLACTTRRSPPGPSTT